MSTMGLRLPESLHKRAREIAKKEGVSINQLVATALAEKLSALDAIEYLEARAARGSRASFLDVLSRVPGADPQPGDELPHRTEK